MRAAVALRNVVRVGSKRFVVRIVPLKRHFDVDGNFLGAVFGRLLHDGLLNVNRVLMNRTTGRILKKNKRTNTTLAFQANVFGGSFIRQFDINAGI